MLVSTSISRILDSIVCGSGGQSAARKARAPRVLYRLDIVEVGWLNTIDKSLDDPSQSLLDLRGTQVLAGYSLAEALSRQGVHLRVRASSAPGTSSS